MSHLKVHLYRAPNSASSRAFIDAKKIVFIDVCSWTKE